MDSTNSKKKGARKKTPSPRRDGREAAVQFLYGHDIQGETEFSDELMDQFWELRLAKPIAREFAKELVQGVSANLTAIDSAIESSLENYSFSRLTNVERSILRLGAFEILFTNETPHQVAINEGIEIAKRLGNEDSPGFVNGILDRVFRNHNDT
ncbi:MAG: transcription antitermination factor NusB [Verrucomicrobiota bacterium]